MGNPIITFIRRVLGHWVSLMTGELIVLLLVLYERISKTVVPISVYVVIAAFTLFVAAYMAWKDEYLAKGVAQQKLDDRQKRKAIREQLANLMRLGSDMVDGYDIGNRPTEAQAKEWAQDVSNT